MKMSESLLRTLISAIRKTNARYVDCTPTIPLWMGTFAHVLEEMLDAHVS